MENKCNIIRDLLPLYAEGIVSEDTAVFVEAHIKTCEACAQELEKLRKPTGLETERKTETAKNEERARIKKIQRKITLRLQTFSMVLMMLGMIFGLGLTTGGELFYNALIMPFVGVLGYIVYRWRAVYAMPIVFFTTHAAINLLNFVRGMEYLDAWSFVIWTMIYGFFIIIGVAISYLLHFAFKKETKK